jgi:ATP-dependent protease ClpP protease subunit
MNFALYQGIVGAFCFQNQFLIGIFVINMAKELLLYYGLYNFTCEELIKSIDANMDEEIVLRVNSPGGDVFSSWGVFAKMIEHGNVTVKVDGLAASGAANLLMYANKAESLDISRFLFHRANAYVDTPEQQVWLDKINADLRKKLEAKVSADLFKEVTGHTYDEMFNPETRLDIWLDAKQMKKLGIISKITKLTPAIEKTMAEFSFKVAASMAEDTPPIPTKNPSNMTPEEFKAKHPEAYASIVKASTDAERRRVKAWMAYNSVDPAKVKDGIDKGEEVTADVMAEMQVAMMAPEYLEKLKKDSAKSVTTAADPNPTAQTDKTKVDAAFENDIRRQLGLKVA